eukprot:Skav233497  [mRNA]  locus=scaffold6564:10197:12447:- [translate_table: standard]
MGVKHRHPSGVFDENDNRTFEEEEFVEMLLALFRGSAVLDDHIPFSVIEDAVDWLLGESNDALNAPFALFIYRYSTPGEEEDPELFEDDDQKFRLSHTAPVDMPLETAASLDATFLNKHELVATQMQKSKP